MAIAVIALLTMAWLICLAVRQQVRARQQRLSPTDATAAPTP